MRAKRGLHTAGYVADRQPVLDRQAATAEQEQLVAVIHAALREAFMDLPPRCQRLLGLLTEDPPVPPATISAKLGIAVGSIGPNRGSCLGKLRRHPVIVALINADTQTGTGRHEIHGRAAL